MTSQQLVICFSGKIGSGKSTLSSRVAAALEWPRVSFGKYIRELAKESGVDERRETLQRIGAELVAKDIEEFCRRVLGQAGRAPGKGLVVDGVRHLEVMDVIRKIVYPLSCRLFFVDLPVEQRMARVCQTDEGPVSWSGVESHSTEVQAEALRRAADQILDGSLPIETLTNNVIEQASSGLDADRRQ